MNKIRKYCLNALCCLMVACMPVAALAHPGRTDSAGGHKDNKNASGLGAYHYHCDGNPPHLHKGGVCPYASSSSSGSSSSSSASSNKWKQTSKGWTYQVSGKRCTGWKQIDGKWYTFNSSGIMQKGWKKSKGAWYYMDKSGSMCTGWKKVSGKWYFFNENGSMKTGWQESNGCWYWLKKDGSMATNCTIKIKGVSCTFDKNGVWAE